MSNWENITIENYEAYLLDYVEGRLNDVQQAELMAFLALHPECQQALEEFESITLPADALALPEKELLKKTPLDFVAEELLIGHIEGQLPDKKAKELQQKAQEHPEIAREIRRYEATRLKPEWEVVYPDKEALKKENKLIYFNLRTITYMAAAGLALVAGLWLLNPNGQGTSEIKPLSGNYPKAVLPQNNHQDKQGNPVIAPTPNTNSVAAKTSMPPAQTANRGNQQAKSSSNIQDPMASAPSNTAQPTKDSMIVKENSALASANPGSTSANQNSPEDNEWKVKFDANSVLTLSEEEAQERDALPVSGRKRKSIWSIAQKTLSRLNQAGVKTVGGEETDSDQTVAYDLTIGDVSVKHSYSNAVSN